MPALLLVRHGQASFGAADYDVLSERGAAQAAAVADDLRDRGVRVARVVSGALRRQRDTAEVIAASAGVEVEVDRRWDEYDGDHIMSVHSASAARTERPPGSDVPPISSRDFQVLLEDALERWIAAGYDTSADESWPAFADRVADALDDAAAALGPGETGVVCTSGGVIAAACVALLGAGPELLPQLNRVSVNAGITKVTSGRGGRTLISFNEHAHLDRADGGLLTYR